MKSTRLNISSGTFSLALLGALVIASCGAPQPKKTTQPEIISETGTATQVTAPEARQREVGPAPADTRAGAGSQARPGESKIFFEFDSIVLDFSARSLLDKYAAYMLTSSKAILRVEGHTDARGTQEYNLALGKLRAEAVADYLILKKVPREHIATVSYGEEKPVSRGQGERVWKLNRRTDLVLQSR